MKTSWDDARIALLQSLHEQGFSTKEIAEQLNTSVHAVKAVLYRKNKTKHLRRRSSYVKWDEHLEAQIMQLIQNSHSLSEIAQYLNVSYSSLTSKMRRLDLRFYKKLSDGLHSPKDILGAFQITESQLRQALNNRNIECEIKGKNLVISEQAIEKWLSYGKAFTHTPLLEYGKWYEMWVRSMRKSLENVATMDEISEVFGVSKMSITYYGKKKNFPPVISYLQSYNVYDRKAVNAWAEANNMRLLPPTISPHHMEDVIHPAAYNMWKKVESNEFDK
jgi:DNA-binding CsgD family transcriptional regulator